MKSNFPVKHHKWCYLGINANTGLPNKTYYQTSSPFMPPLSVAPNDLLVAAGIGYNPYEFEGLVLDVPYGPILYSTRNSILHEAYTGNFSITEAGEYLINYQIAASDPALESTVLIAVSIELKGSLAGTLDSFRITQQNELAQRSVIAYLAAGESIVLQASHPEDPEMMVSSTAIVIQKLP